ncbi:MAG TPA: GNAT family N-acetyltransferase [Devosiaceae bacterium]|nr:GNAT family N-acetyltransferase [Devosiaceae bacterium]
MSIVLETERMRLGTWDDEAVERLLEMHQNADVQRYLDREQRLWTRDKAAMRVGDWLHESAIHALGKFPIRRRTDGAFIGRAGFSLYDGEPEIGYSIARPHWRQGYASEIAAGLRDWFFANRKEASFIGFAHVDNVGSLTVLERIGMTPTYRGMIHGMLHQFYVLGRPQ